MCVQNPISLKAIAVCIAIATTCLSGVQGQEKAKPRKRLPSPALVQIEDVPGLPILPGADCFLIHS